ncbi:hypothetical protein JAAARDRAFT_56204 [Jaapia argillacea MUCL 33604]|uniref:Uncharacterized protein n=1 Tax=Jaapia argillacea MUCL 33604 TaxID=933084 RepID=A0A067Q9T3_9AGAM|nr:hypothetical protein JAAARDRAFT_56204 [Jaapia argillacea MUCL 33604]
MPKAAKESSSSSSSVRRPYGIGLGQPPVKDMPLFLPDPDEQEAVLSRPTTPHKRQVSPTTPRSRPRTETLMMYR